MMHLRGSRLWPWKLSREGTSSGLCLQGIENFEHYFMIKIVFEPFNYIIFPKLLIQ